MGKTLIKILAVVALAAPLVGCAGARGELAFDQLRFPVSSSAFIYAPDGRPVTVRELQRTGQLVWVERVWGIFWSWIPLSGTVDVSAPMNDQIARAGGQGVINLRVESENCGINYVPLLNLLPIYPGCTYVTITGDIVRLRGPVMAPPPPPGAPVPAAFVPTNKLNEAVNQRLLERPPQGGAMTPPPPPPNYSVPPQPPPSYSVPPQPPPQPTPPTPTDGTSLPPQPTSK